MHLTPPIGSGSGAELSLPIHMPGSPNAGAAWRPGTGQPGRVGKNAIAAAGRRGVQHRHSNTRTKRFLDNLSNSGFAVRCYSEGGATSPAEDHFRRRHAAIFGAIYHPDNYDPSAEGEAMVRDIDVLNEEMEAASAWFFAGGRNRRPTRNHYVSSPAERWSSPMDHTLRPRNTLAAFGYSMQPNMDEAVAWGRKAVVACRASVEVREFLAMPTE